MISRSKLYDFLVESNKIEGITAPPSEDQVEAATEFLKLRKIKVSDVEKFVGVIAPHAQLRNRIGLDVRVGNHIPPDGSPIIESRLKYLLDKWRHLDPHHAHQAYEELHPFTDGNGRSGRLLCLWQMRRQTKYWPDLGFLHTWYYQSLSAGR